METGFVMQRIHGRRSVRLDVECLEDRCLPSATVAELPAALPPLAPATGPIATQRNAPSDATTPTNLCANQVQGSLKQAGSSPESLPPPEDSRPRVFSPPLHTLGRTGPGG